MGAARGPGDYHGTMNRAELEREAGGRIFNAGPNTETGDQVQGTAYHGTYIHGSSDGSYGSSREQSGSSGSSYEQSSSSSSSSSELDSNDVVETKGGKWVWSEAGQKWEWVGSESQSQEQQQDNTVNTGSDDSGWVYQPDGTWARETSAWRSSSSSSQSGHQSSGGVGTGVLLPSVEGMGETGHQGSNDTGWVDMPDGTRVKKTQAWASWSSSSYNDLSQPDLDNIHRDLENRVRNQLPSNVEPGYENQYRRRSRRSLAQFEEELAGCGSRCTVIKCTIGPLEKEEQVLFKIHSRLFTETQIKNYAEKVKISSKLVTKVTQLPFPVPDEHLALQTHSVNTIVIPSEPGEAGIPWWVWFLAALGGVLLLALITYCLYRCGFFKRRRPEGGPETEPLQSNGY